MSEQLATIHPGFSAKTLVRRLPLVAFFVIAFAFTWTFLIADALGSRGLIPFRLTTSGPGVLITIVMGYGPAFAALIVAYVTRGKSGIGDLMRRYLYWRVGMQWYAAAILGPVILFFLASRVYVGLGGTLRALPPVGPVELALNLVVLFLVHGLVNGEEIGWRGFALPRLQGKQNALISSLILGIVWALFHLPLFFTQGGGVGGSQANFPIAGFVVQVVASSILVTWIFNSTRGSLLLAACFHASVNTVSEVFASSTPDALLFWLQGGLFCVAAVVVVSVFGATNLARLERVQE